MAGGLIALLASVGVSRAAPPPCSLGTEYPVLSVTPYKRSWQSGGYYDSVNRILRGADIRVAAQPGLTAPWLQRKVEAEMAAGQCQFGDANATVEVYSEDVSLVVRVTSSGQVGHVNEPTTAQDAQAVEILRRARELPTR